MRCSYVLGLAAACALALQDAAPAQLVATPLISSIATHGILPEGTALRVTTTSDLSTATSSVGDRFEVVVAEDVVLNGAIMIPKGAVGHGEVTFVTRKGGFGKPGILGIALRSLDLGGKSFVLDGRYREEGKDNDGVAGATMFAVGIFAGFVQGKTGLIPKGRTLKARTGEDIPLAAPATAASPADAPTPVAVPMPLVTAAGSPAIR